MAKFATILITNKVKVAQYWCIYMCKLVLTKIAFLVPRHVTMAK